MLNRSSVVSPFSVKYLFFVTLLFSFFISRSHPFYYLSYGNRLNIFLPRARQCGLDLDAGRLASLLGVELRRDGEDASNAPSPTAHPALLNAVYLLACHFASHQSSATSAMKGKAREMGEMEKLFLQRTLRGIASALETGEGPSTSPHGQQQQNPQAIQNAQQDDLQAFFLQPSDRSNSNPSMSLPSGSTSTSQDPHSTTATTQPISPLIDAIRASTLLATYFFGKGRMLEGYYHSRAAADLAVSIGLNRQVLARGVDGEAGTNDSSMSVGASRTGTPSSQSALNSWIPDSRRGSSNASGSLMVDPWSLTALSSPSLSPSPALSLSSSTSQSSSSPRVPYQGSHRMREYVDERTSAFWSIFLVDQCWSVATGLPPALSGDAVPDLEYGGEAIDTTPTKSSEKKKCGRSESVESLKAKAAALFEGAARISSSKFSFWHCLPFPSFIDEISLLVQEDAKKWEAVCAMEITLANFGATLPDITSSQASGSMPQIPAQSLPSSNTTSIDPEVVLVHTLTHAATVQLFHPSALKNLSHHLRDQGARKKCVGAARAIASLVRRLLSSSSNGSGASDDHAAGTGVGANSNAAASSAKSASQVFDPSSFEFGMDLGLSSSSPSWSSGQMSFRSLSLGLGDLSDQLANFQSTFTSTTTPDPAPLPPIPTFDSSSHSNSLPTLGPLGLLNPIIGTCWMVAADVFVREKARVLEQFDGVSNLNHLPNFSAMGGMVGPPCAGGGGHGLGASMPLGMGFEHAAYAYKMDEEIDTIVNALTMLGMMWPLACESPTFFLCPQHSVVNSLLS